MTHASAPLTAPVPRRFPGGRVLGWLGLLLGLGAALLAGQAALTTRQYPDRTGVVGEIVAGRHVGQTFIARYSGLSGIDLYTATYLHGLTGEVVLHVRADAHATTDLVTVRLPAATLPNNDWITFAFPPLTVPAGTPLYVDFEAPQGALGAAPTVYSTTGPGDPYDSGQTVLDGQPQPGDLAFALRYQPPFWEPWLRTLGTIAARLPTRPAWTLPLAALLLLVGGWGLAVRGQGSGVRGQGSGTSSEPTASRITYHASRITHHASRFAHSALLLIAVAHAWLWLWIVPPWQGPDEPQHYATAALWARQPVGTILAGGAVPDPATAPDLEPALLAAMDRHSFTRTVAWYDEKGGPAAHFIDRPAFGGSSLYVQERQPSLYYRLGALVLRAAGGGDPARLDPDVGLYLLRLGSLLGQVIVVALGGLAAAALTPGRPRAVLRVALPLGLALWPMPVFIHTVANNDVLAGVAVAGTLAAAAGWLRADGSARSRLAWGALTGVLALAGLLTKSTAVVAVGVFIGAAGLIAWRGVQDRLGRRAWIGAGLVTLVGIGLLFGLASLGLDRQHTAAGWAYGVAVHADRRAVADAHEGGWVLAPPAERPVAQRVDLPPGHPPLQLAATAWVRTAQPGAAQLALQVDSRTVSSRTLALPGAAAWTPVTLTGTAPLGSLYATVVLVGDAGLEADDLALTETALAPSAVGVPGGNRLGNPSAEVAATALAAPLRSLLSALPGLDADQLTDALLNPLPFDGPAAVREFLIVQARSFLGLFGWLSIPLPEPWYTFWAILAVLAGLGLLFAWPRLSRLEREWLVLSLVVLVGAVGLGVAKSLAQWALFGLRDPPQGRYLFVLLIPILWLGLTGGRGILDFGFWILARSGYRGVARAALSRLGLWVWGVLLAVFAAWALLAVIVPYYYGG